jgi:hypothetical protein
MNRTTTNKFNALNRFERKHPGITAWAEPTVVQWLKTRPCTAPEICSGAFPKYKDQGLVWAIMCDLVDRRQIDLVGYCEENGERVAVFVHRDWQGRRCSYCREITHDVEDCRLRALHDGKVDVSEFSTEFEIKGE